MEISMVLSQEISIIIFCKTATVRAEPGSFSKNLKKWFPGGKIMSVYEAGFSDFVLYRVLESSGIQTLLSTRPVLRWRLKTR